MKLRQAIDKALSTLEDLLHDEYESDEELEEDDPELAEAIGVIRKHLHRQANRVGE